MGTMKKFRYYDPCTCVALSEHASSDAFVGMKRTICVKARKDPSRTTGLGERMGPRLRELAPRGLRESGGGILAT